jgi:hypothetical protein
VWFKAIFIAYVKADCEENEEFRNVTAAGAYNTVLTVLSSVKFQINVTQQLLCKIM